MTTPHEGRIPPGRVTGRAGGARKTTPQTTSRTAPRGAGGPADSPDSELVAALSLDAKVLLLTGADNWSTHGAEAIGLRPMIMSDGPAGARGIALDERHPSTSLPCPSALGATWDVALVREVAAALGTEARSKGIDVLLGPTINLMRTPLSGRGFEYFAEDPALTARIAVAFVRGLQSAGVAATVKHYAGNDTETQRWTYNATISEDVLREVYLAPFEACVREAGAHLVMAAYNKVNGVAMTEHAGLLAGVLKDEWGFDGVVTSDWDAARDTTATALAALDLVMPGPGGPWGERLVKAVTDGVVRQEIIDDKVIRLLRLARRAGALGQPGRPPRHDGQATTSEASWRMIDPGLLRRATTASFVLLSNPGAILPLRQGDIGRLAVIGPGALYPTIQGGGSAVVSPTGVSTPAAAIAGRLAGTAEVTVAEGCRIWAMVPEPPLLALRDPVTGEPGLWQEFRVPDGTVIGAEHRSSATLAWWDGVPPEVGWGQAGQVVLRARFRPDVTGPHLLGAAGVGHLTITVDGQVVADQATVTPADPVEALARPGQVRARARLEAGREVELKLGFRPAADGAGPLSLRLGVVADAEDDDLLAAAVEQARHADAAIVVVGSADMTESEGFDRPGLALPGRQDELVRRVAQVNPRTVVVVNSGMPVLLPWADDVAAVLQAWLPGQAMGDALADVLFGDREPGGRLPVTVPAAESDCPLLHAIPEGGRLDYAEGLLIGYRGYDAAQIAPRFPFGHGLGYTTWAYESLEMLPRLDPHGHVELRVVVRNTGSRPGREVVQAYLAGPPGNPARPPRTLAAFGVATAAPGETAEVRLVVPTRAFERWDTGLARWIRQDGPFHILVGRSSRDLRLSLPAPG